MSCKNCYKPRQSSGGQQPVMRRQPNINAASELRNPPRNTYQSQIRPVPLFHQTRPQQIRSDLMSFYTPTEETKKCIDFRPAACISAMPCDEKFMNTVMPDGNTVGYYLLRNRIISDQTNKIPFYDTQDPTIMWTTPNDYRH